MYSSATGIGHRLHRQAELYLIPEPSPILKILKNSTKAAVAAQSGSLYLLTLLSTSFDIGPHSLRIIQGINKDFVLAAKKKIENLIFLNKTWLVLQGRRSRTFTNVAWSFSNGIGSETRGLKNEVTGVRDYFNWSSLRNNTLLWPDTRHKKRKE